MCLPDFKEFKTIRKSQALIGYRLWLLNIKDMDAKLKSTNQDFTWSKITKADKLIEKDSGLYSYNNYNYHYYNNYHNNYHNNNYHYYDNYNNDNYYYYDNYNYNYHIGGIIKQYGKVAIHETGYRSKFAIIDTLFTIRMSDAKGSQRFIDWINEFNKRIEKLAEFYECNTITWQDFNEKKLVGVK